MKFYLTLVLFLSIHSQLTANWVRAKGETLLNFNISTLGSDQYYNPAGNKVKITKFREFNADVYAEYGVTERFTTGLYFPYLKSLSWDAVPLTNTAASTYTGIGDLSLIERYQFASWKNMVFSAEMIFGIPTGNSTEPNLLLTGDGEFNFLPRLSAGIGLGVINGYSIIYSGFNKRTRGFSDEFHAGIELGATVWPKTVILTLRSQVVQSLKNGDSVATSNSALVANNISFVSLSVGSIVTITPSMGMLLNVTTAFLAKNIIASLNYSAGYYIKF